MTGRIGRLRSATVAIACLLPMLGAITVPLIERAGAVTPTPSDVVVEWNANAQTAIIGNAGQGPTVAYLHFGMVQGAVYDAVNAIEGGHDPYLGAPSMADPGDSSPAAAAQAAHDVLVGLFPAHQEELDGKLATTLASIPDGPAESGGIDVGAAAASAMLAARTNDGRFTPFQVTQGTAPGEWRSTAYVNGKPVVEPAPWVGNVKPFIVPDVDQLRSDGPHALTSDAYAEDFAEVKTSGSLSSSVRSEDQTDASLFWHGHGAGIFNSIFRQLAQTQDLDITEAARMFAMADLAGADGAIACWNDKYNYRFWRPITAIRLADTDGNPATEADPNWAPLLATPPFPEHPSGHTCISGAVLGTLQDFFHTDKVAFSTFSSFSGTTRSFERFSEALKEIIDARVWSGIHFRTADVQGAVMGKKISHYLEGHYFRPSEGA